MPQQASQAHTSNSSHHKLSIKTGGKNSPKPEDKTLGGYILKEEKIPRQTAGRLESGNCET